MGVPGTGHPLPFIDRAAALPKLGIGVSTEYGAGDTPGVLDPAALRATNPAYGAFLEVGVEVAKGLDQHARAWAEAGWPTTYHFLDVNLDDPGDYDARWLAEVRSTIDILNPAWMCGDAGLWHFGRRDRGHMLLLPPVLLPDGVPGMAEGIIRLREATGLEVLPENPPGAAFIGTMHLLDFFAQVCDAADTGVLIDCAHLAMYQRATGRDPLDGLQDFPLDRIIELHIAGGIERETAGLPWVEDGHGVHVLPDTWAIAEAIIPRATNLKAIVVECERNPLQDVLPLYAKVHALTEGRL